jgi:predicted RNase H-like HicB family nuclease
MPKKGSPVAVKAPSTSPPSSAKSVAPNTGLLAGKTASPRANGFRLAVVVHPAEEGGFWAEVPSLRGCVSEGDSLDEVVANIREAARAWLDAAAEQNPPEDDPAAVVMELPL